MFRLDSSRLGSPHLIHSRWEKLTALILLSLLSSFGSTQQTATLYAETHPALTWQKCVSGTCTTQAGKVVLDVGKRPVHVTSGAPCWTVGGGWDTNICPPNNSPLCTSSCYVDGADYSGTYGVTTSGNQIKLNYVTQGASGASVGSRVYLMDTTDTKYEYFKLLNREFAFDVDTSTLPCGLKGSLYFVAMAEDGGKTQYGSAVAGPKYGTGYCDAKCARNTVFINGQANTYDYQYDPNGPGQLIHEMGSCCAEVDLWNANTISTQLSILPCTSATAQTLCTNSQGPTCLSLDGRYSELCDPYGCDSNPYRMGAQTFYGPGKTVNSNSKITVVTQFITTDGTDTGDLAQIKRIYVQGGVVIQNANINIAGLPSSNVVTGSTCSSQKTVFGEQDYFSAQGGFTSISNTLRKGMVLTMSIADDPFDHMLWLDSNFPVESSPTTPGVQRGTCSASTGNPADVRAQSPNASVIFGNIKFGPIGQTGAIPTTSTTTTTTTTKTTTAASTQTAATCTNGGQPVYAQCGGLGFTGTLHCCPPYTCWYMNAYYSQCVPNNFNGFPTCCST